MVTVGMSNGRYFNVIWNINEVRSAVIRGGILRGKVPGGDETEYRHFLNASQVVSFRVEEEGSLRRVRTGESTLRPTSYA
jgi:hypothetical protein